MAKLTYLFAMSKNNTVNYGCFVVMTHLFFSFDLFHSSFFCSCFLPISLLSYFVCMFSLFSFPLYSTYSPVASASIFLLGFILSSAVCTVLIHFNWKYLILISRVHTKYADMFCVFTVHSLRRCAWENYNPRSTMDFVLLFWGTLIFF